MLGNRPLDVFIAKKTGGKMALSLLAANNAQTVLAAGISSTATSLTVNTGTGTLFPSPVAGTSFFKLTIIDAATGSLTEIVHVTARAGDVFTIQRAQEGTTARAWSANDIAANMMTAGTLSYILGNFQPLDPTLTALAALVGVANKLPYFNGDDTAALTDLTQVGRDIIGKTDIAAVLQYLQLRESFSGVVGQSRNARMSVTAASATATFSADELIVEDSAGRQYRLGAFIKTINLATTGAGGMDTGVVPATGFVALYVIYNPTTGTSALLAVDTTSTTAPEIYGGANMPAGFTASALVSIWRVASGKFIVGEQRGRDISIIDVNAVTTTTTTSSLTAISVASVIPKNAKSVAGWAGTESTGSSTVQLIRIAGSVQIVGMRLIQVNSAIAINAPYTLHILTEQTIYYSNETSGTPVSAAIIINEYSF